MRTNNPDVEVMAVKDTETERPIPSAWRSVFREIVKAFANNDYQAKSNIPNLEPISAQTAKQISDSIQNYGKRLIELPEESWRSSACIWVGNKWDVLIDLWTEDEGASDLVLSAWVTEEQNSFKFYVYMVYVP
jgi:hypothetical protein